MPYRYATRKVDYSDYASGKVFYNLPGRTAFPVRLALEIFERCLAIREASGMSKPVRLYDPCCGVAYHMAVLAFFHLQDIHEIIASDIDTQALKIAARNLALLTPEGMDRRILEIERLREQYGKASHDEALASAIALRQQLSAQPGGGSIRTDLFQADVFDRAAIHASMGERKVDLVITDVPYGWKSSWQGTAEQAEGPVSVLLETISGVLAERAVVAVASAKGEKVSHPGYIQAGKLKLGLRLVTFMQKDGRSW